MKCIASLLLALAVGFSTGICQANAFEPASSQVRQVAFVGPMAVFVASQDRYREIAQHQRGFLERMRADLFVIAYLSVRNNSTDDARFDLFLACKQFQNSISELQQGRKTQTRYGSTVIVPPLVDENGKRIVQKIADRWSPIMQTVMEFSRSKSPSIAEIDSVMRRSDETLSDLVDLNTALIARLNAATLERFSQSNLIERALNVGGPDSEVLAARYRYQDFVARQTYLALRLQADLYELGYRSSQHRRLDDVRRDLSQAAAMYDASLGVLRRKGKMQDPSGMTMEILPVNDGIVEGIIERIVDIWNPLKPALVAVSSSKSPFSSSISIDDAIGQGNKSFVDLVNLGNELIFLST